MSRSIYCPDCDKGMKDLAKRYHELYESIEGRSKGEFLCDGCGSLNPIHIGDTCFASVLLPDRSHFNYEYQKPDVWMNDYIEPVNITL